MKKLLLISVFVIVLAGLLGQTLNDYRSVTSGNWDNVNTWQYWNGTAWATPAARPTSAANTITIQATHTVTITTNVTVDQVLVESGAILAVNSGTMTVNNGTATPDARVFGTLRIASTGLTSSTSNTLWIDGICEYNRNGGNLPVASWRSGSSLEINGLTTTLPGNRSQTFHNLTWNCSGQTANLNPTGTSFRVINGLFKIVSTGTGILTWTSTNTNTKTLGAWEQTGGTVRMTDGTSSITVHLNGDFTMSGGLLTETGTATGCAWVFQGAGHQTFYKTAGTISETISFTVNNGSVMDVAEEPVTGSGSFTLSYGGSLHTHSPQGITGSGASGAIQVTGTRSYSTGGYYNYEGTSPQVTGNGLPATVSGLTIDNATGVTLTNPVQVYGTLYVLAGELAGSYETDGFYSPFTHFLEIVESGELITGFAVTVTTPSLFPDYINRRWSLAGTYSGFKTITFYWNAADDYNHDWDGLGHAPAAYNGAIQYVGTYDTSSDPRWLMIDVESSLAKAPWSIGRDDEETLPVELSSFTATGTSDDTVMLTWITQSETNAAGYYIYRNADHDLKTAELISPMISATNTSSQTVYRYEDSEVGSGLWYYWLQNTDLGGNTTFYGPVSYSLILPTENAIPPIPIHTKIQAVFPNPFNPMVNLVYSVAEPAQVKFRIYSLKGQLVQYFDQGFKGIGNYHFSWNGRDLNGTQCPTGVYLIEMAAGDTRSRSKAVLAK
jgi:hypothetical protein